MATPSPVYLFKQVKHGTQTIQNDCHQWRVDSFRVHQIRFRPGLCPGPRWGSLQRSPDPVAGLRGLVLKEREREKRGKRGEGERKGTGGTDPLTQIPGSAPAQ